MTEEAEETGLRPVGNIAMHADDRPVNRAPEGSITEGDEAGLLPRGNAPMHEPEFSRVQGSQGRGEGGISMPQGSKAEDMMPADSE